MVTTIHDFRHALQTQIKSSRSVRRVSDTIASDIPEEYSYTFFSEFLRPHNFQLLHSPGNERELQAIFSLLEEMAASPSQIVLDVLRIEIVMPLSRSKAERELAWKSMGENFKSLVTGGMGSSLSLRLAGLLSKFVRHTQ